MHGSGLKVASHRLAGAFPTLFPNKIGNIAVDIAVLVGLLWLEWPTEAAIGY